VSIFFRPHPPMPPPGAYRLYAVTADHFVRSAEYFLPRLRVACEAGITAFQLRLKETPTDQYLALARECRAVCSEHNVAFFVDDNVEVAVGSKADGLHVGKDDTPLAALMSRALPCRVGYSVYNEVPRLRDAIACPLVDYVGISIFTTPTKPDSRPEKGARALTELAAIRGELKSSMPLIAIGGLEAQHFEEVFAAGADGVAVVRAIWEGDSLDDVRQRVTTLRREVDRCLALRPTAP